MSRPLIYKLCQVRPSMFTTSLTTVGCGASPTAPGAPAGLDAGSTSSSRPVRCAPDPAMGNASCGLELMRSSPEAEARSGGDCHSTAVLGKAAATTAGRFFVCLSVSPSRGARELHRLVRAGSGQTVVRLRGGWAGNPSNARNSLWRSGSATTSGRCRFCGWTSMTSRPDKRSGIGRTKRHWPVERFDVACARHCFGWLAWWPKRVAGRARCEPSSRASPAYSRA